MQKTRLRIIASACIVLMLALTTGANAATIYSTGNDGTTLISIDTNTGAATLVGLSGYTDTYAAAFTPNGTLWTIINGGTNGQLARFNLMTGAATPVGTPMGVDDVIVLEADNAGTLYAAGDQSFYIVNKTTGQLTLVGNMGYSADDDIMDMAFDNSGTLWAVVEDYTTDFTSDLYTINPATGAATFIMSLSGVDEGVMGLMVDPGTGIMYGTEYYNDPAYLYQINTSTGIVTQIGTGLGILAPHGGDIFAPAIPISVPTIISLTSSLLA